MADPVSDNYSLALQVTGSNPGTWGTVLNNGDLSPIDSILGANLPVSISVSDVNLSVSQFQNAIFVLSGVLTGNRSLIVPLSPNSATLACGGRFVVVNNTTGNFNVTVKTAAVGSTGVIIPRGFSAMVYSDKTNVGYATTGLPAFAAAVNGNPNTQLAGTAGSVNTNASLAFDYTNGILYVCTTTGNAAGAVWTSQASVNLYAVDTGVVNAYVATFAPPLASRVVGLPIRVKIANSNTTSSTLNDGVGVATIVRRDGSLLIGNELLANTIATFIWDGTNYEWQGLAPATSAAIAVGTDTQSAVTPSEFAGAFGGANQSIGTNGYQVLPGGLILQWGLYPTLITFEGPITITFPIAFPTAFLSGQVTAGNENATFDDMWPEIVRVTTPPTTTQMTVYANGSGSGTTRMNGFYWLAIGH